MRSEILTYDPQSGSGLVSGDDLRRYGFVSSVPGLAVGGQIDFTVDGERALDLVALTPGGSPTRSAPSAPTRTPAHNPWRDRFFTFRGRMGRAHFWVVVLVVIGVQSPLWLGPFPVVWHFKALAASLCLWPYLAACVKRLQDLGLHGALALAPVAASNLLAVFAGSIMLVLLGYVLFTYQHAPDQASQASRSSMVAVRWLLSLAVLIQVGFIVWLGAAKGSAAPNRFGAPP